MIGRKAQLKREKLQSSTNNINIKCEEMQNEEDDVMEEISINMPFLKNFSKWCPKQSNQLKTANSEKEQKGDIKANGKQVSGDLTLLIQISEQTEGPDSCLIFLAEMFHRDDFYIVMLDPANANLFSFLMNQIVQNILHQLSFKANLNSLYNQSFLQLLEMFLTCMLIMAGNNHDTKNINQKLNEQIQEACNALISNFQIIKMQVPTQQCQLIRTVFSIVLLNMAQNIAENDQQQTFLQWIIKIDIYSEGFIPLTLIQILQQNVAEIVITIMQILSWQQEVIAAFQNQKQKLDNLQELLKQIIFSNEDLLKCLQTAIQIYIQNEKEKSQHEQHSNIVKTYKQQCHLLKTMLEIQKCGNQTGKQIAIISQKLYDLVVQHVFSSAHFPISAHLLTFVDNLVKDRNTFALPVQFIKSQFLCIQLDATFHDSTAGNIMLMYYLLEKQKYHLLEKQKVDSLNLNTMVVNKLPICFYFNILQQKYNQAFIQQQLKSQMLMEQDESENEEHYEVIKQIYDSIKSNVIKFVPVLMQPSITLAPTNEIMQNEKNAIQKCVHKVVQIYHSVMAKRNQVAPNLGQILDSAFLKCIANNFSPERFFHSWKLVFHIDMQNTAVQTLKCFISQQPMPQDDDDNQQQQQYDETLFDPLNTLLIKREYMQNIFYLEAILTSLKVVLSVWEQYILNQHSDEQSLTDEQSNYLFLLKAGVVQFIIQNLEPVQAQADIAPHQKKICDFIHEICIEDFNLIKIIVLQGFDTSLIGMFVSHIGWAHCVLFFAEDMLQKCDNALHYYEFAISILSLVIQKFPNQKALEVATFLIQFISSQIKFIAKPLLLVKTNEALQILLFTFPQLSQDVAQALIMIKQKAEEEGFKYKT